MKNKIMNDEVVKLVKEFEEVYSKFYKLEKEVESEFEYWNNEENWGKNNEGEDYSMRLYVMKECLKDDDN